MTAPPGKEAMHVTKWDGNSTTRRMRSSATDNAPLIFSTPARPQTLRTNIQFLTHKGARKDALGHEDTR